MSESELPTQAQPQARREGSAFLPGTILANRYRVIAPLGRGGMGEVYRADDLKLGQAVALKFLPAVLREDESRRRRLRDELKLARLVAHPNVCRLWDLVESDGHEFLSMEYVDGEDLASLLRRIGRLPEERAVRLARELCAGLAAVHDQGMLHRDLKPANVIVDGRGRVRLADFGLAALAEEVTGDDIRSGTPAYMSPEQREGREVTVRSDVYSLGLVLYEVFTGRPAFPARVAEEKGSHPTPSSPSSHVKDLDPAIDRAIERCLATDPALRPASVAVVAASLPGGDPLAAALAAGETPSPELVAAVGGSAGLSPRLAVAGLAAAVAGVALVAFLADRASPFFLDLDKPPEVLVHEAQQIMKELGSTAPPSHRAHGFVLEGKRGTGRLLFWYRQSPRSLSERTMAGVDSPSFSNPPTHLPGMAGVRLDAAGVLVEYVRVPAPDESTATDAVDWEAVLRQGGLEPAATHVAVPATIAPVFGDQRYAWDAQQGGRSIRAEAASFRGRPVWFRVAGPDAATETAAGFAAEPYFAVGILLLAAVAARRHLRLGRADREGARRLALLGAVWGIVGNGPLKDPRVLHPSRILNWVTMTLLLIVALWLLYLALEPSVRRRWPDSLVSWTRLLRGRVLDPLVGRDVLLGVLGGIAFALFNHAGAAAAGVRWAASTKQLAGGWYAFADRVVDCGQGILFGLMTLMLLTLLQQLLRRTWAALAVVIVVLAPLELLGGPSLTAGAFGVISTAILLGLLVWQGLLTAVVAAGVSFFLSDTLMTTHLGEWYAASAVSGILATLAVATWGFYASLGGRPVFGEPGRDGS